MKRKLLGILLLGFASGLPYMLVFSTLTAWLRDVGISLTEIGFFAWLVLTYSLKFLWAPFVDRYSIPGFVVFGKRRGWILFSQLIILSIFRSRIYNFIKTIISPFLALPHVTMAIGLLFIFSPSGLFLRFFSPWLTGFERPPNIFIIPDDYGFFLILGLVLKEIPFFILVSISAIEQFSARKFFNLGKSLQHTTFSVWCILLFPLIYRRIRLIVFIVIAFAASVVDMSLLLAPSTPPTLAIQILQNYQSSEPTSLFVASNLALIQVLVILILFLIWFLLEKLLINKHLFTFLVNASSYKNNLVKHFTFALILILSVLSFLTIISSFLWGLGGNWYFPNLLPTNINFEILKKFLNENKSLIFVSVLIPLIVSILSCLLVTLWVEITESLNKRSQFLEWFIFLPLLTLTAKSIKELIKYSYLLYGSIPISVLTLFKT